jgi:hypothetical protein
MRLTGAERQARHRAKDIEKSRTAWRDWSRTPEGTVTVLLNYARDRARREGLPFDLEREFIREKLSLGVCELSGLAIQRIAPGGYRTHPYAPSLDRKEPALGYIKSNVRLVCFAVNRARSDWGDEVLLTIASGLVKHVTA